MSVSADPDHLFRPGVRLAASYFLQSADRIVRALNEDLGPAVVFLGIVWGNVANQAVGRAVAAEGAPVLDRRAPVSVVRLAESLGLPFETVRRYAMRLQDAGFCERQSKGLVIPAEVFETPAFETCLSETWSATAQFGRDLEALGVVLPDPNPVQDDEAGRWVARYSARYFLKGLKLITESLDADLLTSMIFLAVNRANLSLLFADSDIARAYGAPDAVRPDDFRRPVSVMEIAGTLRLPYETTRRRVLGLVEMGACRRVGGGLIVPGAALSTPPVVKAMQEAWRLTISFMGSVRKLGLQ